MSNECHAPPEVDMRLIRMFQLLATKANPTTRVLNDTPDSIAEDRESIQSLYMTLLDYLRSLGVETTSHTWSSDQNYSGKLRMHSEELLSSPNEQIRQLLSQLRNCLQLANAWPFPVKGKGQQDWGVMLAVTEAYVLLVLDPKSSQEPRTILEAAWNSRGEGIVTEYASMLVADNIAETFAREGNVKKAVRWNRIAIDLQETGGSLLNALKFRLLARDKKGAREAMTRLFWKYPDLRDDLYEWLTREDLQEAVEGCKLLVHYEQHVTNLKLLFGQMHKRWPMLSRSHIGMEPKTGRVTVGDAVEDFELDVFAEVNVAASLHPKLSESKVGREAILKNARLALMRPKLIRDSDSQIRIVDLAASLPNVENLQRSESPQDLLMLFKQPVTTGLLAVLRQLPTIRKSTRGRKKWMPSMRTICRLRERAFEKVITTSREDQPVPLLSREEMLEWLFDSFLRARLGAKENLVLVAHVAGWSDRALSELFTEVSKVKVA